MSLTSRQKDLLIYLCNQRQYITINQLSKKFKVSSRSIRNDLDVVDDFLACENCKIIRQPNKGIKLYIDEDQLNALKLSLNQVKFRFLDLNERTKLIALLLLSQERITFDQLAEVCELSRQTIINGFSEVETLLLIHDIKIIKSQGTGLVIDGDELAIRNAFTTLINGSIDDDLITRILREKTALTEYFDEANKLLGQLKKVYRSSLSIMIFCHLMCVTF